MLPRVGLSPVERPAQDAGQRLLRAQRAGVDLVGRVEDGGICADAVWCRHKESIRNKDDSVIGTITRAYPLGITICQKTYRP